MLRAAMASDERPLGFRQIKSHAGRLDERFSIVDPMEVLDVHVILDAEPA